MWYSYVLRQTFYLLNCLSRHEGSRASGGIERDQWHEMNRILNSFLNRISKHLFAFVRKLT